MLDSFHPYAFSPTKTFHPSNPTNRRTAIDWARPIARSWQGHPLTGPCRCKCNDDAGCVRQNCLPWPTEKTGYLDLLEYIFFSCPVFDQEKRDFILPSTSSATARILSYCEVYMSSYLDSILVHIVIIIFHT